MGYSKTECKKYNNERMVCTDLDARFKCINEVVKENELRVKDNPCKKCDKDSCNNYRMIYMGLTEHPSCRLCVPNSFRFFEACSVVGAEFIGLNCVRGGVSG